MVAHNALYFNFITFIIILVVRRLRLRSDGPTNLSPQREGFFQEVAEMAKEGEGNHGGNTDEARG